MPVSKPGKRFSKIRTPSRKTIRHSIAGTARKKMNPAIPLGQPGSAGTREPATGSHSRQLQILFYKLFLFLSLLVGIYLCFKGPIPLGLGFIGTAFVLAFAESVFQKKGSEFNLILVILGWALTAEAFSAVHDYGDVLPQGLILHSPALAGPLFLLGFLLMFMGFRHSPDTPYADDDLNPWSARWALTGILAVAAFMTLGHFNEVTGVYWDDPGTVIRDIRNTKELHIFSLIMPYSFREPGITYWTALLWYLFPNETGIHMQRIGPVTMYLTAIWVMYYLGKEIGNRKTGLLLAALGAANKWLPTEVVWLTGVMIVVVPVSWSLFTLLRLFRKPSWIHFIFWALAIAFGTYSYGAYRPVNLFMILTVFIWLVAKRKEWKAGLAGWSMASLCVGFWILCFFAKNGFVSQGLSALLFQPRALQAFSVLLLALLLLAIKNYLKENRRDEIFLKLACGMFLAAILIYPLVTHPAYGMRAAELNALHNGNQPIQNILGLIAKTGKSFQELFMGIGFWGDSAFDFQSAWVIVLGIAAFLAKPDWKTFVFFALAGVGMAPHILSHSEYNGRALACFVPFLLLGATGLDRFRVWGQQVWGRMSWNRFFPLALLGFFAWQAWTNYGIVYGKWFYTTGPESFVSRQVVKDSPANRVYITLCANCISPECQGILDEGHPLYVYHDPAAQQGANPIYLKQGEKPKDVVVLVFGEMKIKQRLEMEFPKAQWTGINYNTFHYPTAVPGDTTPVFYRGLIPADQISNDPSKSIYYVSTPQDYWNRDFYWNYYGLAHGSIYCEDQVASLRAPYPTTSEIHTASFDGIFKAPADGTYEFSANTRDCIVLLVNQKKMIEIRPSNNGPPIFGKGKIYLRKGDYPVRYEIFFRDGNVIPDVRVQSLDSNQIGELDGFTH